MLKPSCETIAELAKTYNTIPVCREIYADVTTPILLLRKLAAKSRRFYLLESVEGGEKWGRYSFLGYDPVLRVKCKDGLVVIEGCENQVLVTDKPFNVLREILSGYRAPRLSDLPPFPGGFVGYFAYSMYGYTEPVLK
jgi:anthranilate synthase component 1